MRNSLCGAPGELREPPQGPTAFFFLATKRWGVQKPEAFGKNGCMYIIYIYVYLSIYLFDMYI